MTAARVVVVGLGPAGPDLVTAGALAAIERVPHRYLRTTRHPSASVVGEAIGFDHIYERSASIDEVYADIVDELSSAAATYGEVLYAVPGSPAVAEHTVELLLIDQELDVEVLPALSFLDLAWVRLGIDPLSVGVRVVDGHRFSVEAAGERGPLLVAQCDRASVLSDIKLAVDEAPELPVTVLARLGLPDESLFEVVWDDLDRVVDADHLTSLWIPELAVPVAAEVQRFDELVARLRVECPWDQEQTHRSLSRHLLEETHEVLEVLDAMPETAGAFGGSPGVSSIDDQSLDGAYDSLEEELGDLLFQICFHTRLASEAGRFTLADVARRIHDKLVGRHPHVFGSSNGEMVTADTSDAVVGNWEQIKQAEKGRTSAFDGIPPSLPALAFASKVLLRAQRSGIAASVSPDAEASGDSPSRGLDEEALGTALLELVARATDVGIDAEQALRRAASSHLERLRESDEAVDRG